MIFSAICMIAAKLNTTQSHEAANPKTSFLLASLAALYLPLRSQTNSLPPQNLAKKSERVIFETYSLINVACFFLDSYSVNYDNEGNEGCLLNWMAHKL